MGHPMDPTVRLYLTKMASRAPHEFWDRCTVSAVFMESDSSFLSSLAAQLLEGRSPFEVGDMTKWACTNRCRVTLGVALSHLCDVIANAGTAATRRGRVAA